MTDAPLTEGEMLALILLLRDGPISGWDMAVRLGWRPVRHGKVSEQAYNATSKLLNALKDRGAAHHTYNEWTITEPGRIQAGILMAAVPALERINNHEQP